MSGNNKKIVLIGYSGHGYVIAEAAKLLQYKLTHYCDKTEIAANPYNLTYLGFEADDNFTGWKNFNSYILGLGNNTLRCNAGELVLSKQCEVPVIIHPSASVADNAIIGKGTFIARNAAVNPLALVGDFAIVNTGAIVEHECVVGKGAHIAPGAVLAGNVIIGERTFIGANSVIKQGIKIGNDVIVGAGSVVLKDIANGTKLAGNPARTL